MDDHPQPPGIARLLDHARFTRSLARALVRDEHEADDLFQDAWVAALERPPERGMASWLRAVTRNLAINRRRSTARRLTREVAAARPEGQPSAAETAAKAETLRRVMEAVHALEEPYRSTILMRFYDDLGPSEIASRTGVPLDTVRSRLQRALRKLRERLDRDHHGDRGVWKVVLVSLDAASTGGGSKAGPGGAGGAAGTGGIAMAATAVGTKSMVGAALVVLLLLAGAWWTRSDTGGGPGPGSSAPLATPAGTGSGGGTTDPAGSIAAGDPGPPVPAGVPASPKEPRPVMFRGGVYDALGVGVPGAKVTIRSGDRSVAETRTAAGGQYKMDVACAEGVLDAEAKDLESAGPKEFRFVGEQAAFHADLFVFDPARDADLSGMVVDGDGAAIVGARISITRQRGGRARYATTGATGSFAVRGLPWEPLRAMAEAEGFLTDSRDDVVPGGESLKFVLRRLFWVRVRLAGASYPRQGMGLMEVKRSDGTGMANGFDLAGVGPIGAGLMEPGRYEVSVSVPGAFGGPVTVDLSEAEREREVEIVLQPGLPVSGVVRGEDGAPLPKARVTLELAGSRMGMGAGETVSDSGGSFRFPGTRPGPLLVRAAADGLLPAEVEAAAGREDLVLTLRRGKTLEGRVLDGARKPVEGASVTARLAEPARHREERDSTRQVRTDGRGRFVLENLSEAEYRIDVLSGRGSGGVGPVRPGAPDVVVVIAGFGRIEGVLDGLPSDVPVVTVLADRDEERYSVRSAKVRPQDPFALEQLPPGTWRLRALAGA